MTGRTFHAYERWAATYDTDPNPQTLLEESAVLEEIRCEPGLTILDAGCGTGRYSGRFHALGARVVGADFSPGMLRRAREKSPAIPFIRADLSVALPFRSECFDRVNCAQTLKHLGSLTTPLDGPVRAQRPERRQAGPGAGRDGDEDGQLAAAPVLPADCDSRSAEPDPERNMMEQTVQAAIVHQWYARPVFFVSDVQRALDFYISKLGFVKKWHEADGAGKVCQIDRGGCEIILFEDATRGDRGRLFIELSREGAAELLRETEARSVPTQKSWWGYDVLRIEDPDGNELLVCLEW